MWVYAIIPPTPFFYTGGGVRGGVPPPDPLLGGLRPPDPLHDGGASSLSSLSSSSSSSSSLETKPFARNQIFFSSLSSL